MLDQVTWKDYGGVDGFGAQAPADLTELRKALTAGNDVNNPGSAPGVGFPLRVESLEATLKNVSFRMEQIRLFKALPKDPAFNTVEEHNVLNSYGQNVEGFVAEGALPIEDDAQYTRETAQIKFMGTTRKVSHVMTLVKPAHGNVIGNEVVNGTMHLLKQVERALFYGDSSLSGIQFDGYIKQIEAGAPANNVIDLRGAPLDEDKLVDAALSMSDDPNFGIPTHFHCNPKTKADLVKAFFPKARFDQFSKPADGMVGLDIGGFMSPAGPVKIEPNVFIQDGGPPPAAASGDATLRPGSPTISTGDTTPVEAAANFTADDAGDYFYSISAHNDYGASAAVAVDASAIAIAAGDKMTFGVTPAAAGVKWFQLYRSRKDGVVGQQRLIARIPNAAGAGETIVDDLNARLPFTTHGIMWQQNDEVVKWKQLAPFLKVPLATIDANIRWMQLVYGVPVLYAPGKTILFKNIGRAEGYVGQP